MFKLNIYTQGLGGAWKEKEGDGVGGLKRENTKRKEMKEQRESRKDSEEDERDGVSPPQNGPLYTGSVQTFPLALLAAVPSSQLVCLSRALLFARSNTHIHTHKLYSMYVHTV